jgi:hypothetical protein
MLNLDQCRRVLGPECQLTDGELERLRDEMYALADIAITTLLEARARTNPAPMNATSPARCPSGEVGETPASTESQPKETEL